MFDHLIEKLEDELTEVDKKVGTGQDLNEDEYDCVRSWAHSLKSLVTVDAMYRAEDEENDGRRSFDDGRRSMRYSRSVGMRSARRMYPAYRGSRRGSRSDGEYSYHGGDDEAYMKLQEAYDNAQSEQERKTIRKLMEQMEM